MGQKKKSSRPQILKHPRLKVFEHPILAHHLTTMRKKETKSSEFRRRMNEMSRLLVYEATRDLPLQMEKIETPLESMSAPLFKEGLIVVSIMRAGNGMLDGALQVLPFAEVGHIGIYRDKFIHSTVEYYFRLPEKPAGKRVLLLDPLLATGSTVVAAVNRLKQYGVGPIRLLSILTAPKGLESALEAHPDIEIYCVTVDRGLSPKGYILPGVGDSGDRLYGTL